MPLDQAILLCLLLVGVGAVIAMGLCKYLVRRAQRQCKLRR